MRTIRRDQKFYLKLLTACAGFATLSVSCAVLWSYFSSSGRWPASTDADDESPVVYAHDTIEDLEREGRRMNRQPERSYVGEPPFASLSGGTLTRVEARNKLALDALQARRARYVPQALEAASQGHGRMAFPLFSGAKLIVRFQNPSSFRVNHGILIGQVEGDPKSTVQVMASAEGMSATIKTSGREFRIVSNGPGEVVIAELDLTGRQR